MSANLTPRRPTSTTWTDLPSEFAAKIKTVFENQFKTEAQYGEFLVDGRIYPEEVVMRVGFLESGRLKQINFEASMDLPKRNEADTDDGPDDATENTEDKTMERLYVCIDALGSLMEEYFELGDEEEIDVPLHWRAYEFEEDIVFLQHSTVNTRLEEEADRILGLLEKQLVHETQRSEDALANADVDNELALEIQKAIRSGRYQKLKDEGEPSDA